MNKLVYLPEYNKLSQAKLHQLQTYCAQHALALEICVPINTFNFIADFEEAFERYMQLSMREWNNKFNECHANKTEVNFHKTICQYDLLSNILQQEDVSYLVSDNKLFLLKIFNKNREKIIGMNTINSFAA